jgi:hypothetical protein
MKHGIHNWALVSAFLLGLATTAFGQAEEVLFSVGGGFYDTCFSLSMESRSELYHVRYTVNGATPDSTSRLYEQPIMLNDSLYSRSKIYTIPICPSDLFYLPDSVQHCIVIRAAVFDENDSCLSRTFTNSYFIKALGCDTHGLPVVSICADSLDLFDYERGILVPGIYYDSLSPLSSGNYYQKGREWERVSNVEYYDYADNSGINQLCGLRTHGNRARRQPQKGLKIYARQEYGKKRFKHQFFESSPLDSFKRLVIKPFSSRYPYSGDQDYICSQTAIDMGLEAGLSRPVVLYLNGEYWGIYFLQEKLDERYLESHFGISLTQCDIVGNWHGAAEYGEPVNGYGIHVEFADMMHWLETADLSREEDYLHLCELVDIDDFMDYIILETFFANTDWPANNMRCWKTDGGRWRWIFYDGDATLYDYITDSLGNVVLFNAFGNATYTGNNVWPSSKEATLLFRKCLENQAFANQFEIRLLQLCHDVFAYENTGQHYAQIKTLLSPEIAGQSYRFGYPKSVDYWNWACTISHDFLLNRVGAYIAEYFGFVGIEEHRESVCFSVFPNPASGVLFVRLPQCDSPTADKTEYHITNLMGQVLLSGRIDPENQQIDISALPAGMYFISVGETTRKFVVK